MKRKEDAQALLYSLILDARRDEAAALLEGEVKAIGFHAAVADILGPVLRSIGERWSLDGISLAQAYVAGKVAEDLVASVSDLPAPEGGARPGVAVIGNAEDDYHSLGRRMVSAFLRLEGWEIHDLGNDVLASAFVDEAERRGARVIGVSAMMLTNARNIVRVREEIDRRGLGDRIGLAVGGAVFTLRPGLVGEVGGDGTAASAIDAPKLFAELAAGTRGARFGAGAL